MRISRRTALPAIGGLLLLLAGCGRGYGRTDVDVTAQLGPEVDLYAYSSSQYGDWRANYRQWSPAFVYEVRGHYYANNVRGSRQVQVYNSKSGYFLPPRDQDWNRTEKRFNHKKMPRDEDYGRGRSRP